MSLFPPSEITPTSGKIPRQYGGRSIPSEVITRDRVPRQESLAHLIELQVSPLFHFYKSLFCTSRLAEVVIILADGYFISLFSLSEFAVVVITVAETVLNFFIVVVV